MINTEYNARAERECLIDEGREEGRNEVMTELVQKMLNINLPNDQIIQISGWNEEKILNFAKKMNITEEV